MPHTLPVSVLPSMAHCRSNPNENTRAATLEKDEGGSDQKPSCSRTIAKSPKHHIGNQRGYTCFNESRQHAEIIEGEQPKSLLTEAEQGKLRVTQAASLALEEFVSLSPPTSSIFSLTPTSDANRFLSFSQEAGGNTVNYDSSSPPSKETSMCIDRKHRSRGVVSSGHKPSPKMISWVELDKDLLRSAAEAYLQLPELSSLSDEETQNYNREAPHPSTNKEEGSDPEQRLPPRHHAGAKKLSGMPMVAAMPCDPDEAIRDRLEESLHRREEGIDDDSHNSDLRHRSLVVPQHIPTPKSCDLSLSPWHEFTSEDISSIAARVMENGTQSLATSFNDRSSARSGRATIVPATRYFLEPSSYTLSSSSFHTRMTSTNNSMASLQNFPYEKITRRGGHHQRHSVPPASLPYVPAQDFPPAMDGRKSARKTVVRAASVGPTTSNSRSEAEGGQKEGEEDHENNKEQQNNGNRGGDSGRSADKSLATSPSKGSRSNIVHVNQNVDRWNARFQELRFYKAAHGHCNVPFLYAEKAFLAPWVKRQRYQYKCKVQGKHSHLTDERLRMLDDLGFVWDTYVAAWEENFERMVKFHKAKGHCYVPMKQKELSTWAKRQRRHYKQFREAKKNKPTSTMTEDRIRRLNSIDFPWTTTLRRILTATPTAADEIKTVTIASDGGGNVVPQARKKSSGVSLTNTRMFADETSSRRRKPAPFPSTKHHATTPVSRRATNDEATSATGTIPLEQVRPHPEISTTTIVRVGRQDDDYNEMSLTSIIGTRWTMTKKTD